MHEYEPYDEQQFYEFVRRCDEIFEIVKARAYSVIDNVTIPVLKERFGDDWKSSIKELLTKNPADDNDAGFVKNVMEDLYCSITTAVNDFSEDCVNEELLIDEIGYKYPNIAKWLKTL